MAKVEKLVFNLWLLFLPTQLGRHFWPSFSQVLGLRIDYLSPTVYLTDIFAILLFLFYLRMISKKSVVKNLKRHFSLLVFTSLAVLFLALGMLLSTSPPAGFYKLGKLFEIAFLIFYISQAVKTTSDWQRIGSILAAGVIFETLLSAGQFLAQGSIGGVFWWLGERTFNGGTPGIAQAVLNGALILRPYGTFSHPNVLAGFLLVSLILIANFQTNSYLRYFAFILGIPALLLTFSRTVFIVGILSLGATWFLKQKTKAALGLISLILAGAIFMLPRFLSLETTDSQSIFERNQLNSVAIRMIKEKPILGVGLNNFLLRLPEFETVSRGVRLLQPTHNVYLLIGAETGLAGLGLFFWVLFLTYKWVLSRQLTFRPTLPIALSAVLLISFFDHYFYTLQQGQMLIALVFGLCFAKSQSFS